MQKEVFSAEFLFNLIVKEVDVSGYLELIFRHLTQI